MRYTSWIYPIYLQSTSKNDCNSVRFKDPTFYSIKKSLNLLISNDQLSIFFFNLALLPKISRSSGVISTEFDPQSGERDFASASYRHTHLNSQHFTCSLHEIVERSGRFIAATFPNTPCMKFRLSRHIFVTRYRLLSYRQSNNEESSYATYFCRNKLDVLQHWSSQNFLLAICRI